MKFTVIVILALVFATSMALKPRKLTSIQQNRILELQHSHTWAGIILNLAEIHLMSHGPLEELTDAIQDTIGDLQTKRQKVDEAYVKRTNEHNELVQRLEAEIANAEQDIEDIINLLESLREQKIALEEENASLVQRNSATRNSIAEATRVRELTHEEYLTQVEETEQAIEAVDECLTILNEFVNGGASFAQLQIKKAKTVLAQTQQKLQNTHSIESPFLNALISVAVNQEFADHAAVIEVINKFQEIRENLLTSSSKLAADEAKQQAEFEKFVADGKEDIYNNEQTIEYNNGLLVENQKNTQENQILLQQRKDDLAAFQQELDEENISFDEATKRYEAYCEENDREIAVCNEALDVLSTVDFEDYIGDRINAENGLISSGMATATQHGQGGEVFKFDYGLF